MPKINVLPREVAELIAAGEVIERPASIVKELVENAIDAGSTAVTVEIQHGGVKYLRVTDNGCGIEREDAPKAFMRHATSKVRDASDLDSIGTLGFRGEALASIAAVAHVEMMTKVRGAAAGTLVQVSGSEVVGVSDAGCPDGTTIVVRDVFYNVPARLKFLKKDATELGAGGLDRRQNRPLPPGDLLLLHPGRQAGLPHPRQWRPDGGGLHRPRAGFRQGDAAGRLFLRRGQGQRLYLPPGGVPFEPVDGALFRQRPVHPHPHLRGRAGRGLPGDADGGEVPFLRADALDALRAGGRQRPPGQDRGAVPERKGGL